MYFMFNYSTVTYTIQKFGVSKIFEVSYVHQDCIYLIQNTVKKVIIWNNNNNVLKYSCDAKLNFQQTPLFSVTWSFRNHCWFAVQETFLIIIYVKNSCEA